jgi:hypothetical protein
VRRVKTGARTLAVLCWLSLVGCGTDSPPDAPTLQLPFTSSPQAPVLFNSVQGVEVGTTGNFAFGVLNAGTANLIIQEVSYAGDPAMMLLPFAQPLPVTLAFNSEFVVALQCTPAAAASYSGAVSITSNASNSPDAVVYLACVGMPPP